MCGDKYVWSQFNSRPLYICGLFNKYPYYFPIVWIIVIDRMSWVAWFKKNVPSLTITIASLIWIFVTKTRDRTMSNHVHTSSARIIHCLGEMYWVKCSKINCVIKDANHVGIRSYSFTYLLCQSLSYLSVCLSIRPVRYLIIRLSNFNAQNSMFPSAAMPKLNCQVRVFIVGPRTTCYRSTFYFISFHFFLQFDSTRLRNNELLSAED